MDSFERTHPVIDRWVDIISVLLLSITSVLSATCVYQSTLWSSRQTELYNSASANRVNAGVASGTSNETRAIDVALYLRFLDALRSNDTGEERFLIRHLGPEARTALTAWLKTDPLHNPRSPQSPFSLPEYRLASDVEMHRYDALAAQQFTAAQTANGHADAFVSLTVMFASVAFLAGMSTKFRFPFHLIVVTVGCIALIYGVFRLLGLAWL